MYKYDAKLLGFHFHDWLMYKSRLVYIVYYFFIDIAPPLLPRISFFTQNEVFSFRRQGRLAILYSLVADR